MPVFSSSATRVASEAVQYAQRFVKQMPLAPVARDIVNQTIARMWDAADWQFTVGDIPTVILAPDTIEYSITYPDDWGRPIRASLIDSGENLAQRQIQCVSHISEADGYIGSTTKVWFKGPPGIEDNVRIAPRLKSFDTTKYITGTYKKAIPIYTNEELYTEALPFPDDFYYVFQEGVLWHAYLYADDRRAGDTVVSNDRIQHSGQRAVFEAALLEKRRNPLLLASTLDANEKER